MTSLNRVSALVGSCLLVTMCVAPASSAAPEDSTSTPIKHVIVIYDENISFDHYFATYPHAANIAGETLQGSNTPAAQFTSVPNVPPDIDTLVHAGLDGNKNPNMVKPFRLTPGQALTCDQNHDYKPEQEATDSGKMDKFVEYTSADKCPSNGAGTYQANGLTMGYFDGNTVAAWWNLAQRFALSDNYYTSTFGPSSPGVLNMFSGTTWGARSYSPTTGQPTAQPDSSEIQSPNAQGIGTMNNDNDPAFDDCSDGNDRSSSDNLVGFDRSNLGDQLTDNKISWGWFQGGFKPTKDWDGKDGDYAQCMTTHNNVGGNAVEDYLAHHNAPQFYKQTANPHHLPPKDIDEIGHDGQAKHIYDLSLFQQALDANKLPAVTFLRPPAYQEGHAGYSDPVDEQHWVASTMDTIQKSQYWKDTAVILAYDDSDGWYDHRPPVLDNGSNDPNQDVQWCSDQVAKTPPLGGELDRCGPGTREPLLVVSPYAKRNFVDHTDIQQASIMRFIQENWHMGQLKDNSFDEIAKNLNGLFDFTTPPDDSTLLLRVDNGAVAVDGNTGTLNDTSGVAPTKGQTSSAAPTANDGRNWGAVAGGVALVAALVAVGVIAMRRRGRS